MKKWSLAKSMTGSSGIHPPQFCYGGRVAAFLESPVVISVRMAMAMRGKKSGAMLPEQGPDLFAIGLRQCERIELVFMEEAELTFAMRWGKSFQPCSQLEKEHEPVGRAFVGVLAHNAGEMERGRFDF